MKTVSVFFNLSDEWRGNVSFAEGINFKLNHFVLSYFQVLKLSLERPGTKEPDKRSLIRFSINHISYCVLLNFVAFYWVDLVSLHWALHDFVWYDCYFQDFNKIS